MEGGNARLRIMQVSVSAKLRCEIPNSGTHAYLLTGTEPADTGTRWRQDLFAGQIHKCVVLAPSHHFLKVSVVTKKKPERHLLIVESANGL